MKILPFRFRAPLSANGEVLPGRRMKRMGLAIMILGVASAALLYLIETRNAGPSMEELMPGYSRANSRLMGIYYGHAGQMMWEWRQALAQPATQALIVVAVAAILAAGCFRMAWIEVERSKE